MTLRLPILSPFDTCSSTQMSSTSKLSYFLNSDPIQTPSFSSFSMVSYLDGGSIGWIMSKVCALV